MGSDPAQGMRGAQVSAYAFTFPDESSNGTQIRMMLPLLDLLNHGNEGLAPSLRACLASWPGTAGLPACPPTTSQQLLSGRVTAANAVWTGVLPKAADTRILGLI